MQLLLTFSETNLLDFSESASPVAPLAAEAACIMAPDFGVLGNSYEWYIFYKPNSRIMLVSIFVFEFF